MGGRYEGAKSPNKSGHYQGKPALACLINDGYVMFWPWMTFIGRGQEVDARPQSLPRNPGGNIRAAEMPEYCKDMR